MKLLLKVVGQSVDEMMLMVMICESDWSEWFLTSMLHLPLLLSIANNYGVVVILVRYGAVL